jgi:hypothetical protein
VFNELLIPLVRTREVIGHVLTSTETPAAGGIAIEILDESGAPHTSVRTFADGEFYLPRLRPGRYLARIAAMSLAAMDAGAKPATLAFTVTTDTDQPVRLPPFRLEIRQR